MTSIIAFVQAAKNKCINTLVSAVLPVGYWKKGTNERTGESGFFRTKDVDVQIKQAYKHLGVRDDFAVAPNAKGLFLAVQSIFVAIYIHCSLLPSHIFCLLRRKP